MYKGEEAIHEYDAKIIPIDEDKTLINSWLKGISHDSPIDDSD